MRNLLQAMKCQVAMLHTRDQSRHAIEMLTRLIEQCAAVLTNLQANFQPNASDTCHLETAIANAAAVLHHSGTIRISISLPPLPQIIADSIEVQRVFMNLLLNARDAMPNGGQINIEGELRQGAVHVTVRDEGHGIPTPMLKRIFDHDFSTKGPDHGLGLTIVREVMARLNGNVQVARRPTGGMIFTLRFPVAQSEG
jgi:signal transduction histidine kinase